MAAVSRYFRSFSAVTAGGAFRLNPTRFFSSGSTNHNPQGSKFQKHRKGTIKGVSGNEICFGKYGLQALESARITSRQIEAGRRAMTQVARRGGGKLWVRIFPHKSVTGKPAEVRMGRGKGNIQYWVAVARPGRILYELGGVAESVARRAIEIAASKMPIRTRFLVRDKQVKEIGLR